VVVQDVTWTEGGSQSEDDYTFFLWKWECESSLTGRLCRTQHSGGFWCDTVLIVHAPTEDKTDDTKDSIYEEPERIFHQF
jgi:hypothetical protein